MEIIARDWHLVRELTALDTKTIMAEKIDFDRRNLFKGPAREDDSEESAEIKEGGVHDDGTADCIWQIAESDP